MDLSTSQFVIGSNIATGKHYQVTAKRFQQAAPDSPLARR
jgi:hypothetical protein